MALRGKFHVKDLALSVYECYLTGHGSTGKFEMGTKHRMRNEVPQIGMQCSARTELLLCAE